MSHQPGLVRSLPKARSAKAPGTGNKTERSIRLQKKRSQDRKLWGIALIATPLLTVISTFFWEGDEYGIIGGTLVMLAGVFWIPAFTGLFNLLREKMPYYSSWGLLPAIYGNVAGSLFGFRDIYAAVFNISQDAELEAAAAHSLAFNLTLFWAGPLVPLSLLVLGIFLIWRRAVRPWIGVLTCLGAAMFPLSRILRVELIGHATDLLLLIPLAYLGWAFLTNSTAPYPEE